MPAIAWNDSLSVGINSIDNQHKKLIALINEFYDKINQNSNNNLIMKLISGMKSYTVEHFSTEEAYMRQYAYPQYEQHKKEHDSFVAKVNTLEDKYSKGTIILSFEITSFIKDWIKHHIQNTDKQYTDFFLKNGVR